MHIMVMRCDSKVIKNVFGGSGIKKTCGRRRRECHVGGGGSAMWEGEGVSHEVGFNVGGRGSVTYSSA